MGLLRTGVFVLTLLPAAVSCSETFFSHTIVCYLLDAFLLMYCIVFTVFFFREKYLNISAAPHSEDDGTYQELERPKNADPYQVLEPKKKKKKAAGKNKPKGVAQPPPGGASAAQ